MVTRWVTPPHGACAVWLRLLGSVPYLTCVPAFALVDQATMAVSPDTLSTLGPCVICTACWAMRHAVSASNTAARAIFVRITKPSRELASCILCEWRYCSWMRRDGVGELL